jgi:hypothetical protein
VAFIVRRFLPSTVIVTIFIMLERISTNMYWNILH